MEAGSELGFGWAFVKQHFALTATQAWFMRNVGGTEGAVLWTGVYPGQSLIMSNNLKLHV